MNLERTPLLLEARRKRRKSLHRGKDRRRARSRRLGQAAVSSFARQRPRDLPTFSPRIGIMRSTLGGPAAIGGIMRHS